MTPRKDRFGWVPALTCAILTGAGSWYASTEQAEGKAKDLAAVQADHRYVMRAKVDSLRVIVQEQGRHIRRLERRAGEARRLPEANLTPLGPPEPRRRSVFRRVLHFFAAEGG